MGGNSQSTRAPQVIHVVAGARPNFMKVAPLFRKLSSMPWASPVLIHTGQHYDENMSEAFFRELELPKPHYSLGVGSGSHAEQTAKIMVAYERVISDIHPDLVVVVGDVNSTVACTLTAVKLGCCVGHLEAGLRSLDRSMPEEINRVVTDALSHILWTPSADADENLLKEGIPPHRIERVGNIMIDSLEMLRDRIARAGGLDELGLEPGGYALATLHRPANVDNREHAAALATALCDVSQMVEIVLPLHPRTKKNFEGWGILERLRNSRGIRLLEPLPYVRFMNLLFNCRLAITDSGGIQEETTYLGIPCLTLRPNTERPITVKEGTNRLCEISSLTAEVRSILESDCRRGARPIDLWDGRTAARVVDSIRRFLGVSPH